MSDREKNEQLDKLLRDILGSLEMTLHWIEDKEEAESINKDITEYWRRFTHIRHAE
ncbi:hypothetical cyanophage protein [Synechococcus phage S-CRM01]|uniref:hypothetical cyanophage protein n=1 Tax=Synechococcus phage S-CRM01 TaxID=1026955 RepID=UPI000209E452|nr:hypothetical cyanophage protein [Synechococcus phage S-CRM01]AEC53203.1 hypothetical cyanophage protein [Synechococcus phage S-CRM01]